MFGIDRTLDATEAIQTGCALLREWMQKGGIPLPLHTFLEECGLSGKTIIPFCPHGSGFSRTERTIAELQPNAVVSEDGMTIPRNSVATAEDEIIEWAEGFDLPQ